MLEYQIIVTTYNPNSGEPSTMYKDYTSYPTTAICYRPLDYWKDFQYFLDQDVWRYWNAIDETWDLIKLGDFFSVTKAT